ncbi:uncharacterized protein F4822DRAFT_432601 [Hypoxylon trugodes]|uniref:uncharacterized protein n=1 Tax=Hypoxylon trugodes TaxID=326681 RepID=UPI0021980B6A|nr:uncharacterized protein F4822DRAFT_432601 [Hypoxylon trugodes]KAI1385748.1 hypothetical protein F4822DRAFT_432601 [Hypoxylon trugodes]
MGDGLTSKISLSVWILWLVLTFGLSNRGTSVCVRDEAWSKVEVIQTVTAASSLALGDSTYMRLAAEITHIVHIAWPMNFKLLLSSFDASLRTRQNLIQLPSQAYRLNPTKRARFLFISSISTVANYHAVTGESFVPESRVDDLNWSLDLGYAKAKLVCGKVVERTATNHPEIEIGLVRVGQLVGARSGFWNSDERFVTLTLSWLPVDIAVEALSEITFSSSPLHLVYHLENPVRRGWQEVVKLLTKELGIPRNSIIPLRRWLDLNTSTLNKANPTAGLSDFIEKEFPKMLCGKIILDTSFSRAVSPTMRRVGAVDDDKSLRTYVSYWRRIGILK